MMAVNMLFSRFPLLDSAIVTLVGRQFVLLSLGCTPWSRIYERSTVRTTLVNFSKRICLIFLIWKGC